MPGVQGLSEAELAERAATTPERLHELVDRGIIALLSDGSFRSSDLQRVRFIHSLERSGISLEDLGKAIETGHLSFAFLDLLFTQPAAYTTKTYREMCEELGWSIEFVQRVHEALGLPTPSLDDPVREDDVSMFPVAQFALSTGVPEAGVIRSLRVYGENLGRITQAESQFFHTYIEEPMLSAGMGEREMSDLSSQVSPMLRAQVEGLIWWLYHRYQEHSIFEHLVNHVEEALEQAGLARRQGRPPAMVFLDLAGYTKLTEEQGDEVAAELAATLASLVQGESQRRGGRPVKWLGDGVMFHFPDPGEAVICGLELVEQALKAGLPPAHVGVNAGPVVFRDGDYFGRTVNIASRIAARARPGEVLVSEDVISASRPAGVRFDHVGPVQLKGVSRPVVLHRAVREAGQG